MEELKVVFILRKISTQQFATIDTNCVENTIIKLGTEIKYGIDEKHRMIACHSRIQFISNDLPFIIIHLSCEFELIEDSWHNFVDVSHNLLKLPVGFMQHLAVITIGTARGVLHAKTENTKYNQYFLPTINVTDLVKEDFVFNLEPNS